jgi:hypothetical protein
VLTQADLDGAARTEEEFLGQVARLPLTVTQMTLKEDVLDSTSRLSKQLTALTDRVTFRAVDWNWVSDGMLDMARECGLSHLDALCQAWPQSLTRIHFERPINRSAIRPVLPLDQLATATWSDGAVDPIGQRL